MSTTTSGPDPRPLLVPPPVVELRGQIAPDVAPYARGVVTRVLESLGRPVTGVRVHVVRHPDPARERPVTASVHVDGGRTHVHAHVTADHPREALDLLADRLRRRVLNTRREPRRSSIRGGGEAPSPSIVRRDVVEAVPVPVVEAAAILVDLEQDVHLFLDRVTGVPAVVYRAGPTGLRAAFPDGPGGAVLPAGVTCSPGPARRLSVEQAAEHLALSGLPFLFFVDPRGDARLLHRDTGGAAVLLDIEPPWRGTDRPVGPGPSEHQVRAPEH